MDNDARIKTILSVLSKSYPHAHIALSYGSPWELLVAVILSAQCTDVMVNKVTNNLFHKYPTLQAYLQANPQEFEQDIKSTGFYHNKTKHILAAAHIVQNTFKGRVPKTMDELLTIPGVARKTANVVLGNAYGIVEGIAVDTHVIRLSQRLRLVPLDAISGKKKIEFIRRVTCHMSRVTDYKKDADPVKIEAYLTKTLPKSKWFEITYQLIDHGRAICKAQRPHCSMCPLNPYCLVRR